MRDWRVQLGLGIAAIVALAAYGERMFNYLSARIGVPDLGIGWRTLLAILFIGIVVAAWKGSWLKGLGAAAAAAFLFVVVVPWWNSTSFSSSSVQTANGATTAACPGAPQTYELGSGAQGVVNPNACQLRWKIRTGCVQALDAEGRILSERACAGGDEATVPPGIHSLVALGPATVRATTCGRHATGSYLDSCD